MSKGFLLDTVTVSEWYRGNGRILEHIRGLSPSDYLMISSFSRSEIDFGHLVSNQPGNPKQELFIRFLAENIPVVLEATRETHQYWARLKGRLFNSLPNSWDRKKKTKYLKPHDNDLHILAHAIQHNAALVTADQMRFLKDQNTGLIYPKIEADFDIQIENWLADELD